MVEESTPALSPKVTDLAKRYAETKREIDRIEKELEPLKAQRDQLADSLKTEMEREEMTKFSISGVGTFFIQSQFYPKVVGDEAKAIEWLDGLGQDVGWGVAPRTVDRSRLKELIRDRLDNDQPLPPEDLIQSSSITYVKMLKPK